MWSIFIIGYVLEIHFVKIAYGCQKDNNNKPEDDSLGKKYNFKKMSNLAVWHLVNAKGVVLDFNPHL